MPRLSTAQSRPKTHTCESPPALPRTAAPPARAAGGGSARQSAGELGAACTHARHVSCSCLAVGRPGATQPACNQCPAACQQAVQEHASRSAAQAHASKGRQAGPRARLELGNEDARQLGVGRAVPVSLRRAGGASLMPSKGGLGTAADAQAGRRAGRRAGRQAHHTWRGHSAAQQHSAPGNLQADEQMQSSAPAAFWLETRMRRVACTQSR